MKKTKIISFANHKGGVSKTTTTASVGSILAKKGYKVLLIDLDAQANLTTSLLKDQTENSIYDALMGDCALPCLNISENLDIVPADERLALADIMLSGKISRERILKGLITDEVKERYDFILIDCPPHLDLLVMNALTCSNEIIIPIVAEVLPFKGLIMIQKFIDEIHKALNEEAHISGILIARWESTILTNQTEENIRKKYGDIVFKTKIRKNISLAEAPNQHTNIVDYAPKSNGAIDYLQFTEELLRKLGFKNQ